MWKEIKFLEFVDYRKHYNVEVLRGELYGGGNFGELGGTKYNSRIRWESDLKGTRWYKWVSTGG